MFFPIRSDRRLNSTPWVNLSIIVINVIVYLVTQNQIAAIEQAMRQGAWSYSQLIRSFPVLDYYLLPNAKLYQFITYQFLHASPMHLIGNMVFLYVFGNSVEDRLGKLGYAAFYLAGGVVAALGHFLMEPAPILGASGAVCAVTGAYLVLFPLSNITIIYWFIVIGTFEVSGLLLIVFQIGENVLLHVMGRGGVAYVAHLFGYAYGFLISLGLLGVRLLPREPYDLLALYEQRRRRAKFRNLTRQGYQPWENNKPGDPAPADDLKPTSESEQKLMDLRASIAADLSANRSDHAMESYEKLLELDPGQVMGRQQQLDLANHLMSAGRHEHAARAYELFLNTYRVDGQRDQVELILGLLYARYLDRRQRAKELLTSALTRLNDPQQKELAQQMLAEIG
ncbi:MAG: rhomboid family intramembrane serine protease [Phycisphaeraceae bacterium]|nr:rhomboid family intramembrane serine protease [Phycisphaeraceae bacterium]